MNTKRVVGWVAFFGVAAALTWLPEYFTSSEEGDASVAAVATPTNSKTRGALPAAVRRQNIGSGQGPEPGWRPVRRPQLEGCAAARHRHRTTRQPDPGGASPQLHRRCLSSSLAS